MVESCRAMLDICWYDTGAHVYKHERHVAILHGMPPFCLAQCPVMRQVSISSKSPGCLLLQKLTLILRSCRLQLWCLAFVTRFPLLMLDAITALQFCCQSAVLCDLWRRWSEAQRAVATQRAIDFLFCGEVPPSTLLGQLGEEIGRGCFTRFSVQSSDQILLAGCSQEPWEPQFVCAVPLSLKSGGVTMAAKIPRRDGPTPKDNHSSGHLWSVPWPLAGVPSGTLSARTGESAKLPVRARLSSFRSLWAVFRGGT